MYIKGFREHSFAHLQLQLVLTYYFIFNFKARNGSLVVLKSMFFRELAPE